MTRTAAIALAAALTFASCGNPQSDFRAQSVEAYARQAWPSWSEQQYADAIAEARQLGDDSERLELAVRFPWREGQSELVTVGCPWRVAALGINYD
jgi:hypothetical protein